MSRERSWKVFLLSLEFFSVPPPLETKIPGDIKLSCYRRAVLLKSQTTAHRECRGGEDEPVVIIKNQGRLVKDHETASVAPVSFLPSFRPSLPLFLYIK